MDAAHDHWFSTGAAGWQPQPAGLPGQGVAPTPRSVGQKTPDAFKFGSFEVIRDWQTLPAGSGSGYIVQRIERDFSGIKLYNKRSREFRTAGRAELAKYMGDQFGLLHYDITDYWELFPVNALGQATFSDNFSIVAFASAATMDTNLFSNTSKGPYIQKGTAYFVPTGETIEVFANRFGMTKGEVTPAEGLWSTPGPINLLAAGLQVSAPSVFTLTADWDTTFEVGDGSTKLEITETVT